LVYESQQDISAGCGNLGAIKTFVKRGVALNNAKKYGVIVLMVAAQSGKM
jgi:energy-converting hydrogenase Eha subunit H